MGRYSTGVWTTKECRRIELSALLKAGIIKQGSFCESSLSWSDDAGITIYADLRENNSYIRLVYAINNSNGEPTTYDYKVYLTFTQSNIGKGRVYYFVCPVSGKRCRVLYKAYGSPVWKSREAYNNRIYYRSQLSSKKDRYNDRYWELEHQLEEMHEQRYTNTYKGKLTKRALLFEKKLEEQMRMDRLRWSLAAMPASLQKVFK